MSISPSVKKTELIKHKILRPSLTSHYHCEFSLPPGGKDYTFQEYLADNKIVSVNDIIDLLLLSCSEASLPGSTIATHELNNDFTGVTQRHAYRRLYDDRIDFTFYVNEEYIQIRFFEAWMRYISGETLYNESLSPSKFYRFKYPKEYKSNVMRVVKFERDYQFSGNRIVYEFINSFPISIQSMPVSYDSSNLLKCTVSFTYDRYQLKDFVRNNDKIQKPTTPQQQAELNNNFFFNPEFSISQSLAFQGNNLSPNLSNISTGTLTNGGRSDAQEIMTAITELNRPVESGLPYVGRNRGPTAPFSNL